MRIEGTFGRSRADKSDVGRRASASLLVFLSATIACWPMIVNREPFLLADTTSYIRGADSAAFISLGAATDWTQRYHERFDSSLVASDHRPNSGAVKPIIITGRSIYYGAFLYLADRVGGLRLAAIVQAVLAVMCLLYTIMRFTRMPADRAAKYLFILTSALSVGSSLAFFTSYLEPDLTSALAILAAAHLLTARPAMDKRTSVFWTAVLFGCALMHGSTVLILIVIAVTALIARNWLKTISRRGIALVVTGILIAMAGEAIFETVVSRHFGAPPVRPPFLMARIVADGPGRAFLQENCPQAGFSLCRHVKVISSYDNPADSDTFLWSQNPSNGVFSAVDPNEARRIAAEEARFVGAVFKDRPFDVLSSSTWAALQQLTKWRLSEFNVAPAVREQFAKQLPARIWQQQKKSLAFKQEMPVELTEVLTLAIALLSLIVLLINAGRRYRFRRRCVFPGILLLGVAANILICGTISTPHDRYLMRAAWLIPLAAFVVILQRLSIPLEGATGEMDREVRPA